MDHDTKARLRRAENAARVARAATSTSDFDAQARRKPADIPLEPGEIRCSRCQCPCVPPFAGASCCAVCDAILRRRYLHSIAR